MLFWR